jgi:WD40 repeat protein
MINTLVYNYKLTKSLRFFVILFLLFSSNAIVAQDVPYKTLMGHTKAINDIAFSIDSKLLASASDDNNIIIWNTGDGSLVYSLKGHTDRVTKLKFSKDGKLLASSSQDNTIKIWRLSDRKLLYTLKNNGGYIHSISFSPDNKTIVCGSDDSTIKIWRVSDGTLLDILVGHQYPVFTIDFSPDGKYLASGSADSTIRIWRIQDMKLMHTLIGHQNFISTVRFSPDGKTLVSRCWSDKLNIWRFSEGSLVKELSDPNLNIRTFSYSPDGKVISGGCSDRTIKFWSSIDGTLLRTIKSPHVWDKITSLSYSPDGKNLACGVSSDIYKNGEFTAVDFVQIWRLFDGVLLNTLNSTFTRTTYKLGLNVLYSPNGNKLACYSTIDYGITIWQLEPIIPKPLAPANLQISSIKFNDSLGNNNQVLDGNEKASLQFTINNTGKGDAYELKATISMAKPVIGLDFPKTIDIGDLPAGKSTTVTIPVSGTMQLEAAKAEWNIEIKEGNGFDADPFTISFTTQPFKSPLLRVADYKFTSDEAGKIRLGQTVSLQIMLQNIGQGEATDIKVEALAPENVFPANESVFSIDKLMPNESRILHYEFFANKKYSGTEIPIKVNITEQYKRYGENRTLSVSLDQNLAKTQLVEIAGISDKPISINSIYLTSDVNRDIPVGTIKQPNTFALIIGNEDYSSYQKGITTEMNVAYAKNDALTFKEYCSKTLGIPEENITCILDATAGKMWQEIDRLSKLIQATNGKASVIFYYAGHGLPDEQTKEPYLIPVDVTGSNITAAIKLSTVYEKLTEYPSKQVTVFLDACFSGGARDGVLLASRAIRITPKSDYLKGNIVVFTASSGDESAMPWKAQQHGMFTYFLLKKLQETKGDFTYAELNTYLRENVGLESVRTNSKKQNPQVLISPEIEKNWQEWRLK